MVAALNIGLNLSTALLINVLVIGAAAALTMEARSATARTIKAILCVASLIALTYVVMSLPHQPIL